MLTRWNEQVMDAHRDFATHRQAIAALIQATTDVDKELADFITQTDRVEPDAKGRESSRTTDMEVAVSQ